MNYVGTHSDDTLILMGINKPTFLFYEKYFQDEYKFDNAIFVKDLKKNPLNVPDKIILTRPNAIDSDFYIRKYIRDNNFEEDIFSMNKIWNRSIENDRLMGFNNQNEIFHIGSIETLDKFDDR